MACGRSTSYDTLYVNGVMEFYIVEENEMEKWKWQRVKKNAHIKIFD